MKKSSYTAMDEIKSETKSFYCNKFELKSSWLIDYLV